MDIKKYGPLQEKVRSIIEQLRLGNKTLESIVSELSSELDVKEVDTKKYAGKLCSGFIYRGSDSKYYIGIEESDSPVRKRFTLGHELGHYFMHRSKLSEGKMIVDTENLMYVTHAPNDVPGSRPAFARHVDCSNLPLPVREMETEANEFGAELLMPADKVKFLFEELISTKGFVDMYELSKRFGVSSTAITYRLKNLGLLGRI